MAIPQEESQKNIISIVIASYKRPGLAFKLASNLLEHKKPYEIIIVDQENTSQIDIDWINKNKIKLINLDKGNIARARNAGIKNSTCEIILFIDDDIEISKVSIDKHTEAFSNTNVVCCSGRVLNDGEEIPSETKVITGKTNFLGTKFTQQFWSTLKQEIDFPYGCNMSFRKTVLESVGGFDEVFPRIFDDIDIGFRIKKFGKIIFEPYAFAYHHKAKIGGSRIQESDTFLLYKYYGYYLGKNIIFPLNILSLGIRCVSAIKSSPKSFFIFVLYFFKGLFRLS
jgi:GT2 family glycosyltransferase